MSFNHKTELLSEVIELANSREDSLSSLQLSDKHHKKELINHDEDTLLLKKTKKKKTPEAYISPLMASILLPVLLN